MPIAATPQLRYTTGRSADSGIHAGKMPRSQTNSTLCASQPKGAEIVKTKISGSAKFQICALWSGTSLSSRVTPSARDKMTFSAKVASPI